MQFFKEKHLDSEYPVWYRLYTGGIKESVGATSLMQHRHEIKKWIDEIGIRCKVDKLGTNYRFKSEHEFLIFSLRWF